MNKRVLGCSLGSWDLIQATSAMIGAQDQTQITSGFENGSVSTELWVCIPVLDLPVSVCFRAVD